MMAATNLLLSGAAECSVLVPSLGNGSPDLGEYLLSSDSDEILLGTSDFRKIDGVWECKQAPVDWFSLSIVPIFREVIERPVARSCVDVRVLEATIQLQDSEGQQRRSLVGRAMDKVMTRASISGLNAVRWVEQPGGGWSLTGDITLSLDVTPPRVFPIPRGIFERVGSSIIRATCQQRGDAFLGDVANGYADWARVRAQQEHDATATTSSTEHASTSSSTMSSTSSATTTWTTISR